MSQDRSRLGKQEALTAQPVFALLLSQGHVVADVERPRLGDARSPDFVFRLDGQPVALEVVRYLDRPEAQKASSRLLLVERALQDRLLPDAIAVRGKIVMHLRYSVDALQTHKRADVERDADQFAAHVRAALASASPKASDMIEVPTTVQWILDAQVWVLPSEEPSAYFGIAPGLPDGVPDPDAFIERTIASKADQHVAHAPRAILVVLGMFHDDAEDLAEAFARWPEPIPWWRVYFVRNEATLVYEQVAKSNA